jgi:hypothetical protein
MKEIAPQKDAADYASLAELQRPMRKQKSKKIIGTKVSDAFDK